MVVCGLGDGADNRRIGDAVAVGQGLHGQAAPEVIGKRARGVIPKRVECFKTDRVQVADRHGVQVALEFHCGHVRQIDIAGRDLVAILAERKGYIPRSVSLHGAGLRLSAALLQVAAAGQFVAALVLVGGFIDKGAEHAGDHVILCRDILAGQGIDRALAGGGVENAIIVVDADRAENG